MLVSDEGRKPMPVSLDAAPPDKQPSFDQAIDGGAIGPLQLRVFVLCAMALFAEGFDAQATAYVAPALAREWRLAPGALGPTFAASAVGLSLGAALVAPLADRWGRRPILLWSTFAFGLLTLATAFVSDLTGLLALRLLAGLGFGGAMANAIGLAAEYSPARRRNAIVAVVVCGFGLGAASAGGLAVWLIGAEGWRSVFAVGGVATLTLGLALAARLPESLRFLALTGNHAEVARLAPEFRLTTSTSPAAEPAPLSFAPLFEDGRAAATLLVWGLFFASLLDLYLLNAWLPTTINIAGRPERFAILAATLMQGGGVAGAVALGPLMDRFGPFAILPPANLLAAVCMVGLGAGESSVPLTLVSAFGVGVGLIGGQNCNHAMLSDLYPTRMRARGIGVAHAFGRLGSIAGPLLGGAALSSHLDIRVLISCCAAPMVVAAACSAGLGLATRGPGRAQPNQR
jgi:AAHS family 4-hydroxybenzoate transporter-like MFS transporter